MFSHITELHDSNDKMRLVLMGFRRSRTKTLGSVKENGFLYRIQITGRHDEIDESDGEGKKSGAEVESEPLLMVETENVKNNPFKSDQEVKVEGSIDSFHFFSDPIFYI